MTWTEADGADLGTGAAGAEGSGAAGARRGAGTGTDTGTDAVDPDAADARVRR